MTWCPLSRWRRTAPGMALLRWLPALRRIGWCGPRRHRGRGGRPPLAADIAEHLEHAGLPAVPRYGSSALRIDLALTHPSQPDRTVLASSRTATATRRLRRRATASGCAARCSNGSAGRHLRVWSTDRCVTDCSPEEMQGMGAQIPASGPGEAARSWEWVRRCNGCARGRWGRGASCAVLASGRGWALMLVGARGGYPVVHGYEPSL